VVVHIEVKDDQDEDATREIERGLEAFFAKLNEVCFVVSGVFNLFLHSPETRSICPRCLPRSSCSGNSRSTRSVPLRKDDTNRTVAQTVAALDDPNKEVDLDMATKKLEELIAQTVKVNPPKFDPKLHDSPIDFFESFIEKVGQRNRIS